AQGQWFWVQPEKERADFMGFTVDPTDANRFYASGHPPTGGNLGFQVSENRGQDWKQVSLPGVDFHALAIAPRDPTRFYGWAASGSQGLFVSTDGGKTWTQPQRTGLGEAPFSLAVDPSNPERVFATTGAGLYESTNGGDDWTLVPNTSGTPVAGLALSQEGDNTVLYGYRRLKSAPGVYRSTDGGKSWKLLGAANGTILSLTVAPSNPQILYVVNENNAVLRSQDRGKTWKELS
ncbi:MAG TPA: YCF48-related protein, partial [Candidatus Caenarcaniphilales bacterium]